VSRFIRRKNSVSNDCAYTGDRAQSPICILYTTCIRDGFVHGEGTAITCHMVGGACIHLCRRDKRILESRQKAVSPPSKRNLDYTPAPAEAALRCSSSVPPAGPDVEEPSPTVRATSVTGGSGPSSNATGRRHRGEIVFSSSNGPAASRPRYDGTH
jgi:hypothetical protein